MGRRVIGYLAVFLLTVYCFFVYDDAILETMVVIEIVYFFISVIYLLRIRGRLQISLEPLISVSEKNKEIPINIKMNNTAVYTPVSVMAVVKIENTFTGEKSKIRLRGRIEKNDTGKLQFHLCMKECGNVKITLDRVIIYDILFILKKVIRVNEVQYIGILPECHLLPIEITRNTREFIADAEEYSDRESGDDPMELYQIREYREKDSIHNIHWKLSAKMDDLLVKENGKPLGCVVLIWINLYSDKILLKKKNKKKRAGREIPSDLLELAASISLTLLEEKCVHLVAWYEQENKVIQGKRVSREEHIYELLNRLLYVNTYRDKEEVTVLYEEAFRGVDFSTTVELNTHGEVIVDGNPVEIPKEKDKVKWEELYFKV